jgi:16S rRNA processing protein RimM
MDVVVGRLGRPHGVHGEISVEVRTDDPEKRFAIGAKVTLKDADKELTIVATRWHLDRMLITFAEVTDRNQADEVKGKTITVSVIEEEISTKTNEFYEFQLVGLPVFDTEAKELGEVKEVLPGTAQSLIVVKTAKGEVLVPFVNQIVPKVDLENKKIIMNPPVGLFDEENAEDAR